MNPEETTWIERVRTHDDRQAFASLVGLHQSSVRHFLQRLNGGDSGWADELAQDTFLTAHRLRERYRGPGQYRTWLLGIARNLHRNAARRKVRWRAEPLPEDLPHTEPPRPHRGLEEALQQLSEEQRTALHLFFHEQLPVAEIAQVLDLPEGTIKSHLSRGKERLRQLLSPAHERA